MATGGGFWVAARDVSLEMGKPIPEPVIHLDIPYGVFRGLKQREELEPFVV